MPDKYDFEQVTLGSIAGTAIGMQNDFMSQFTSPRYVGEIDETLKKSELLKLTYVLLLKDIKKAIDKEIESIENE